MSCAKPEAISELSASTIVRLSLQAAMNSTRIAIAREHLRIGHVFRSPAAEDIRHSLAHHCKCGIGRLHRESHAMRRADHIRAAKNRMSNVGRLGRVDVKTHAGK